MKKIAFVFLFISVFVFSFCYREQETLLENDSAVSQTKGKITEQQLQVLRNQGKVSWEMQFPNGTRTEVIDNRLRFELPKGYYAKFVGKNGEVVTAETGSITCTCNQGSGCYPFSTPTKSGCLMEDGCSVCTKTVTKDLEEGRTKKFDFEEMEIMLGNPDQKKESNKIGAIVGAIFKAKKAEEGSLVIETVDSYSKMQTMESITEHLLNEPQVKEELVKFGKDLQEYVQESKDNSKKMVLLPLAIKGRLALLEIPKGFATTYEMSTLPETEEPAKASCTGCDGTCKYHSTYVPFVGTVHYCDGCGSGCTLHLK